MADNSRIKQITSNPKIGLLIFPFTNRYRGINKDNFMNVKRIDATSSVRNLVYQKSKSDASGTFSITLSSDQNWKQVVRPGDWLVIYESSFGIGIVREGEDTSKGMRCLGNVDRVSKQKTISVEGKIMFTYKIEGRDFGKILEKMQFYYNPYTPEDVQRNFTILKAGIKITGSPESFLRSYLDLYLGKGFIIDEGLSQDQRLQKLDEMDQFRIPDPILKIFGVTKKSGKLLDILRIEIGGLNGSLDPDGYSWSIPPDRTVNGYLWDILMSVSNTTMNELYTSMKYYPAEDRVYPTITLRQLPFGKSNYIKLPNLVIQEDMIITDDMGFNDHERYNWLNLDPKNAFIANYSQFMAASQARTYDDKLKKEIPLFPSIDELSIKRYGLQQKEFESEFIFVTEADRKNGSSKTDLGLAEEWMEKLLEWWKEYERFESGTMILKGFSALNQTFGSEGGTIYLNNVELNNAILENSGITAVTSDTLNIGTNIYNPDSERLYHLEGYSLEWSAPGELTITIAVTRGVYWAPGLDKYKFVDEVETEDQTEIGLNVIKRK